MFDEKPNLSLMEIFIPCFYILGQYQIGNKSLGTIALVCMIFWGILKAKYIVLYKPLIVLTLFMFIHDLIKAVICINTATFPLNMWIERLIYIIFLAQCINNVDEEKLYKVWKIIGIFAMIGLVYHAILVYGFGQNVQMIRVLPFTSNSISFTNAYARPRSIFLEPAAYVTWILPLLYMSLKREKIFFSGVITVTILLSTSTTGVLITAILWGIFMLNSKEVVGMKKIFLIFIVISVAIIFIELPIFEKTITKLGNTDFFSNIRITAGLNIYKDADMMTQLFGIKYNTTEQYFLSTIADLGKYNMSTNAHWLGFVNSIARSLLMYGIIGGILYVNLFYRIFKDSKKELTPYIFICFVSTFGQSVFFNSFFLMQFAMMFGTNELNRNMIGVKIK